MVFIVGLLRKLDDVVYGVICVQNGTFVKVLLNIEAKIIAFMERCSVLRNKLLNVCDKFHAISLDLVTRVTLNESAWMLGIKYAEDVSVLFEKDSEDKSGKSGEISRDEVKMNESKAISDIEYEKYASETTEKDSKDEDKSEFQFSRLLV